MVIRKYLCDQFRIAAAPILAERGEGETGGLADPNHAEWIHDFYKFIYMESNKNSSYIYGEKATISVQFRGFDHAGSIYCIVWLYFYIRPFALYLL